MSRSISGRTRWLGIFGDPILHASAPGLINELLHARNIDAVMVPMHVAEGAAALHERFERHYPGTRRVTERADAADHQIVINATSLGMHEADDLSLDPRTLNPTMLAAEIVIKAEPTPFLAAALAHGCAVQPGRPMLEAQLELMLQFVGIGCG
jgi:shikimate 5-dehydrogenase